MPSVTKIGSVAFPVDLIDQLHDDDGRTLYGRIEFMPKDQIKLWGGQSLVRLKESFLHEVIHAVDERLHLGLRERQVGMMSVGLFEWMRDNSKTAMWMIDEGGES